MTYDYLPILLFFGFGILFPLGGFAVSYFLRPSKPEEDKDMAYECGEIPLGSSWVTFHNRYYIIAVLFVIFDVESVFMYPWAVSFGGLGAFAFIEMALFILVLGVGYLYAWRMGALEWAK